MAAKVVQGIQSFTLMVSFLLLLTWPLIALYVQMITTA